MFEYMEKGSHFHICYFCETFVSLLANNILYCKSFKRTQNRTERRKYNGPKQKPKKFFPSPEATAAVSGGWRRWLCHLQQQNTAPATTTTTAPAETAGVGLMRRMVATLGPALSASQFALPSRRFATQETIDTVSSSCTLFPELPQLH